MQGSHLLHPEEAEQGYEGDKMAVQGVHGFNGSMTDTGIAESYPITCRPCLPAGNFAWTFLSGIAHAAGNLIMPHV
jgi:hypothetical protein